MRPLEESAINTYQLTQKLGQLCIKYGLNESDIFLINDVKKYGKTELVEYVIDHAISLKQLEELANRYSPLGW